MTGVHGARARTPAAGARPQAAGGRAARQGARAATRSATTSASSTAPGRCSGESGSDACIEEIAARAHVGVGTVYRRFASKDALMDELLRLALDELIEAADQALARTDGHGLEQLLRAFGQSFADHASYANLLLEREPDPAATAAIRTATAELTARAVAAGTVGPGVTPSDVTALVAGMRGLVQTPGNLAPEVWERFLDIHLAGLRVRDVAREAHREPASPS